MNFFKILKSDYLAFKKLSKNIGIKNKKARIIYSVILRNLAAFIEIIVVILFSYILTGEVPQDNYLENIDLDKVKLYIPLFVILRIGLNYLDHINQETLMISISKKMVTDAAEFLFLKENLSFSYINYKVFAETSNITSIYKIFISIIGTLFQLITFSFTLFFLNFEVGLTIILISALLFFPIRKVVLMFKLNTEQNTLNTIETHNNLDRILSNYYLIKLLKKEKSELKRFEETVNTNVDLSFKNAKLLFLNHNMVSALTTLIVSIGVIQTFVELNLTLEIIFLLIRGAQFISQITSIYSDLLSKKHFIKNYLNDLAPKEFEKLGTYNLSQDKYSNLIKIKNVSFKYDGSSEFIFENLFLEIEKYSHNIIIGSNGSGKSTLLGIITNIYKPNSGDIEIFSDKFGYIGPTPLIFKDSLINNLTYGYDFKISNEEITSSILELNIFDDFKLEDLFVEVTASSLSSGQMQKISFIRALLAKPDILFLDEATSNLDIESVKIINNKLKNFKGTIINVTHKPDQFTGVQNYFEIKDKKIHKIKNPNFMSS